jgi:hypothetical protein
LTREIREMSYVDEVLGIVLGQGQLLLGVRYR